ncbi:hypothetical protein ACTFIC_00520, partial [Campylobacter jejuni]
KLLSKKTNKQYIESEYFDNKKRLILRNELIGLKHSVGNLFLEGQPIDVYMYGGFITLIQQTNSYALLHECFIKGSYFSYIKSNDIID